MRGKIRENFAWIFFTNRCDYCGKLVGKGEKLCKNCLEELPRIEGKRCPYCGAGKDRCNCRKRRLKYDGITSPFYYEGSISECIRRLKFRERDFTSLILARNMAECIEKDFGEVQFDIILYVPFSVRQSTGRIYNQSRLLAEDVSEITQILCKNYLIKLYDSKAQHRTLKNKRGGNVFGIYDVKTGADVLDKTVLLVDDIKTTGATLNECAAILKIRGAKAVYCVTAAIAAKKKKKKT